MKFDVMERKVESFGEISVKEITLSANAKAFKIIFGQIYPDITKAIVRELFTNAWDSQKNAGTLDTPIDIHLPTDWEPYFSVRDYGTGMTPAVIDDVYSKVFESTKDQSDDEAGMFGMGSKTPLGYTDSFSVTSYIDGYFWAYDIYIAQSGNPVIALKAEGECDEPNGVEVSLGVKTVDFNTFKEYAELFALNANTPVNINRTRYLNKRVAISSGDRWTLYDDSEAAYIRMGCVLYKVDKSYLNQYFRYDEEFLLKLPLILDFDIGEFEVTGSREDIIYNVESCKKIYDAFKKVHNDVCAEAIDKIRSFDHPEESFKYFRQVNSQFNLKLTTASVSWKGFTFSKIAKILNLAKTTNKETKQPEFVHKQLRLTNKTEIHFNSWGRSGSINRFEEYNGEMMEALYTGPAKSMTYVVIDDNTVKNERSRIRNLVKSIRNHGYHTGYQSSNGYYNKVANLLWIKTDDIASLKRLFVFLPKNHIVVNIHDIEKEKLPKKEKREKYDSAFRLRFDKENQVVTLSPVHYGLDEDSEGAYYVRIEERRTLSSNPDTLAKYHEASKALKVSLGEVIAVGKMNEYLIDEYNLVDFAKAYDDEKDKIDFPEEMYILNAVMKVTDSNDYGDWSFSFYSPGNFWTVNQRKALEHLFAVKIPDEKLFPPEKFSAVVNERVAKKFDEYYNKYKSAMDDLYARHPVLEFVNERALRNDTVEVLTKLGEI